MVHISLPLALMYGIWMLTTTLVFRLQDADISHRIAPRIIVS